MNFIHFPYQLKTGQRPVVLGPGSLARLLQHAWPGNVRELAGILDKRTASG